MDDSEWFEVVLAHHEISEAGEHGEVELGGVDWGGVPDVIPDWVLGELPTPLDGCACIGSPVVTEDDGFWSTPGVTGLGPVDGGPSGPARAAGLREGGLPPVSAAIRVLQAAVAQVVAADPTVLVPGQALADAQALLAVEQALRIHDISRVCDVAVRGLHELVGFRSARTWLRHRRPDGDSADAQLGLSLRSYAVLSAALTCGSVSLQAAKKVVHALKASARHVDRPDGLIDGQPGVPVITAVVGHVADLVCQHWMGVQDDDPRLLTLHSELRDIIAAGGTDLLMLEKAFGLLATHLPLTALTGALDMLVMALVPSQLDDRAAEGLERAGLDLRLKDDGSGWHLCGDLSLEAGERAFTALRAEANRDQHNPADTAAWRTVREIQADGPAFEVTQDTAEVLAGLDPGARPRSQRRRLHDALNTVLTHYLDHGLAGTSGKVPVQINVTIAEARVTGQPGALPARADSGALLPAAMVRRWWCNAAVSSYVLTLGGKALRVVHSQRTLRARERTGLGIETGQRCPGIGCCDGKTNPLAPLIPHHVDEFAQCGTTSIEETLLICDLLHYDIHDAGRTVLLRDGRYLNQAGFTTKPALFDLPPF